MNGYIVDESNPQQYRFIGINGQVTITQTITFCPSRSYTFNAQVGYEYQATANGQTITPRLFNTTFTVTLDGVTIIPTQITCSNAANCPLPAENTQVPVAYRQVQATIVSPAKTTAQLKIVFDLSSTGPGTPALYDTYFDGVSLTLAS